MTSRTSVILAVALVACGRGSGSVQVDFVWDGPAPSFSQPVFAYARVERRAGDPTKPGTVLQLAGPAEYGSSGAQLNFDGFPNGSDLVVVGELHTTADITSLVLYDGVSAPFSLAAGVSRVVTVPLNPLGAAPETTGANEITYFRTPWGSADAGTSPTFSVIGASGAVAANVTVVVYDEADPRNSSTLGTSDADSTGGFDVPLLPADHATVYVGTLDSAGNATPAAPVHDISWTASFGGKVSGALTANPHVLDEVQDFHSSSTQAAILGTLAPDPASSIEAPTYAGLVAPGDGLVVTATSTGTLWQQRVDAAPPLGRLGAGLAYDSIRGVTVMFGGQSNESLLNDTWEWNGSSWTNVTPPGVSPLGRFAHGMAYDAERGVTVLFGGNGENAPLDDLWEWDGATWKNITPAGSAPSARSYFAMAYDSGRGVTVLFGGYNGGASELGDTWEWSGAAWTEATPVASPPGRAYASMAFDSVRGVSVLFGGDDESDTDFADTWTWDGATWANVTPATSPPARVVAGMAFDTDRGVAVLFGGTLVSSDAADTWEWNGSVWTNITPSTSAPDARHALSMAYDSAHGATVLFGGEDSVAPENDTWTWNGTSWTNLTTNSANPPQRSGHSLSFDSGRSVTVLFGGEDLNVPMADTWEWDGSVWSLITPSGASPSARSGHSTVYDSANAVTTLFGGEAGFSVQSDTWTWDGATWAEAMPAVSPPGRANAAMDYDSGRDVTVLVAGSGGFGPPLNDTWEWNGTTWTQATTAGPSARVGPAMAYDSVHGVSVLFGGNGGLVTGALQDTWEWDGSTWTSITPAGAIPPARYDHSMLFDSDRGVIVMFGGETIANGPLNDTWVWNGTSWADVTPIETSPPAPEGYAMSYDSARGQAVMFENDNETSETWLTRSNAQIGAAEVASFSFAAALATSPAIQQMTVTASAGGNGSSTPGASLAVWDAWSGAWVAVEKNTADVSRPASLDYATPSAVQAARYLLDPADRQLINVAVFASTGCGNGVAPVQLSLDSLELNVQYRQ